MALPTARRRRRAAARTPIAYLFVAPALIVFCMFLAFPVGFATWLAFHNWTGLTAISSAPWVGLANFRALWADVLFRQALWHTVFFAATTTILQMAIAFVL